MSTANRVLKNSMFLYCKIAVTSVCLLLSTRYILQGLGVVDFGIYNLICSTVIMLGFLNDSMTAATQRFMSYAEGEGKSEKSIKIFNTSFTVHLIIALIVAVLIISLTPVVFGNYLQIPDDRRLAAMIVYFFMIFTTCLNMTTVPYNAVLIAHENLLYFSIIGSLNGILRLAAAVGVIYVPTDKLITYGFFMVCVALLDYIILNVYCRRKYKECRLSLRKHTDKSTLKEILSFAVWQMTYCASSMISIQGMSLILNSFYGTVMNAAQGIARQVSGQMMTLSGTMMGALNPVIVKKAGAKDTESMVRAVMTGSKLSYFLMIIISLPIMFELPFLLDVWLTEVPEYSVQFCRWEVVQQIIASYTVTLVTMIGGVGDIRNFQLFSAMTYVVRLPLIYLVLYAGLLPVSAYYVATATVIALCVGRIYFAHVKCALPVMDFFKSVVAPCTAVTILMFISVYAIVTYMPSSWLRLLVVLVVSTIAFLIGIYTIGLNKSERLLIQNFISATKSKFINKKQN